MYGGLGDRHSFGLKDTSQYVAPVAAWNLPSGWTFHVSPGFGLNSNSHGFLLRWDCLTRLPGSASASATLWAGPMKGAWKGQMKACLFALCISATLAAWSALASQDVDKSAKSAGSSVYSEIERRRRSTREA